MPFKKGQSGNPLGRKTIVPPELRSELDSNKILLKTLVLRYFNMTEFQIGERQRNPEIPFIERILGQCFEKTANDGNVDAFRKLLEITFGKIPEAPDEFAITQEEKELIAEYRERKELALQSSGRSVESEDQEE